MRTKAGVSQAAEKLDKSPEASGRCFSRAVSATKQMGALPVSAFWARLMPVKLRSFSLALKPEHLNNLYDELRSYRVRPGLRFWDVGIHGTSRQSLTFGPRSWSRLRLAFRLFHRPHQRNDRVHFHHLEELHHTAVNPGHNQPDAQFWQWT